ncbi:MAG: 3-octaprenyl-4-hydroxybenzoate carboxy-lyase [Syntrophorhabdaceae bacterium PtaU1.Bin034]|nr:MAG: 3-octaprenyl-4-hydroxybenzoate carboxy-lyase [Syntrophorhabdaceae bacterium PtaU1.Bin034]
MKRSYGNLRDFIQALEAEGELLRIKEKVSPILEITEITDRASKSPEGGKALLFEQVEGSSMPVLTNAFGSTKRISMALGVDDLDEIDGRLTEILHMAPPQSLGDKINLLRNALGWSRFLPRITKDSHPPCQEVILKGNDVDLSHIPILQCWPKDGGRFVTLPLVFSRSLRGQRNAGMYRLQVFDRNTMGMHWHIHKDGAQYFHEHGRAGKRMEVAVAIGTDPAVTYAATAPMPFGIDEMLLAGFIRQAPVKLVKGVTVDIEVPAEAEIVLEGYVDHGEERLEGPFGDHTGFYSAADNYPVFHVTAITHRKDAVYSTTIVGRPPMEDCYLAKATERIFLPLLRTVLPEVVDYRMPWEGVFHNLTLVSIDKRYPGQASKVMHGLWGSGQMSFCKAIFVFDATVDLSKGRDIAARILNTVDLRSDILISRGILDVLDHASPAPLFGGKIGVNLTTGMGGEGERHTASGGERGPQTMPSPDRLAAALRDANKAFLDCRLLFQDAAHPVILMRIAGRERIEELIRLLLSSDLLPARAIVVFFDRAVNLNDEAGMLWRACANVDPARDFSLGGDRLVIDATSKKELADARAWPEEIRMSRDICRKVTEKAAKLGIADLTELEESCYE